MSLKQLELKIKQIEERNSLVEANKAWEVSWARKILIAGLTYLVIAFYLILVVRLPNPWINALVPTIGFILSTLSMELIKDLWIKYIYRK